LVDCWLPYGETEIYVSVEMDNLIEILQAKEIENSKVFNDELLKALDEPVNSPTLDELIVQEPKVALIIEGSTSSHYASQSVTTLVRQLVELIVPSERITVLIGEVMRENGRNDIVEALKNSAGLLNIKIVDHTWYSSNLVEIGSTHSGTPIIVDRDYTEANIRIAIGETRLDSHTGFIGAHTAVIPGIASPQTLTENRRNYFKALIEPGVLEMNPVKEDQIEAVKQAKLNASINIAVNPRGDLLGIYYGEFEGSWGKAITALEGSYELTVDKQADITVVSAGGFRYDFNLYNASWALREASKITKRNGTIILLAECSEGLGAEAFTKLSRVTDPSEFERRYTYGADALQMLNKMSKTQRIILVSGLPKYLAESFGVETARTANEAYQLAMGGRRNRSTYVVPFGSTCKFNVKE
jgi:nickel-dependent lactate racemase